MKNFVKITTDNVNVMEITSQAGVQRNRMTLNIVSEVIISYQYFIF